MLYTSAEANKLLRQLQEERFSLEQKEGMSDTFVAATIENPEDVKPEYDFENMQSELKETDRKIRMVKHAINMFNMTHMIPEFDNMTIDEMLVYLPQLKKQKEKLNKMCNKLPKSRKSKMYGEKSNFIEYEYANYDIDLAKKYFNDVSEKLSNAQLALDKINAAETMEINI